MRPVRDRVPAWLREAVARRVGIDPRALAALRVALGLLLLADLALRSRSLVAHYTDAGILPRSALRANYGVLADLSLHALSGGATLQVALFLLAGAASLALAAGYRTRLAAVVAWLLLVSLHARNPLLLNGGDSVLRRVLFWSLFLPLGRVWSVDAVHREAGGATGGIDTGTTGGARRSDRVVAVATVALLTQVVLVYLANGLLKLRGDRWLDGTAIRYVFGLDHLTTAPGELLAGAPALLTGLSHAWFALVLASGLLVLLTGRPRAVLVAVFAAMHLGMGLTLRLGLFPAISVAALLVFLPTPVWERLERRGRAVLDRADGRYRRAARRAALALPGARADAVADGGDGGGGGGGDGRLEPLVRLRGAGRRAVPVVVAVLLALVLVWNGMSLGYVPAGPAGDAPREYRWDMFAPEPRHTDGWYVVPAETASGERVDAWRGGPVRWGEPRDPRAVFPSDRWLVYLLELQRSGGDGLREAFAGHVCRRWNASHADPLRRVSIHYVQQPVTLDESSQRERRDLGSFRCSAVT